MNKLFRILLVAGTLAVHTTHLNGQVTREQEIQTAISELERFGEVAFVIKVKDVADLEYLSSQVSIAKLTREEITGYVNKKQFQWLIRSGLSFRVKPHTPLKRLPGDRTKNLNDWTTYPYLSEYYTIMEDFAMDYPGICLLDTFGYSVDGKLLLMLKISDNVSTNEPEPNFLYTSTMHGNETGGFMLMLRLADYILKNYTTDQRVAGMVDNLQIWINPLFNPDGFYRSYDSLYLPIRSNSNGVDLNRNFPDPEDGPHPDGNQYQQETVAMMDFMDNHPPIMSANFHSGAEVMNYPWDTWETRHADDAWFQYISHEYADTAQAYSADYLTGFNDGITNGYDWYSISGGRQDYVTYFLHGREVTMEISDAFVTPEGQLDNLWQYNYRSLLNYLEQALFGIRGTVKDTVTQESISAKIELLDHDTDSSHVYSDSIGGDYYRLINAGTYRVKFSAPGYYDKIMDNVVVQNRQATQLDVKLVPISSSAIGTMNPIPEITFYPNPFTSNINVSLILNHRAPLEFQIFDILGKKQMVPYSSVHTSGMVQIGLDLTRLSRGIYVIRTFVSDHCVDQRLIRKQ